MVEGFRVTCYCYLENFGSGGMVDFCSGCEEILVRIFMGARWIGGDFLISLVLITVSNSSVGRLASAGT